MSVLLDSKTLDSKILDSRILPSSASWHTRHQNLNGNCFLRWTFGEVLIEFTVWLDRRSTASHRLKNLKYLIAHSIGLPFTLCDTDNLVQPCVSR
jgi:hypothetical protein